jgi:hypothetical protein
MHIKIRGARAMLYRSSWVPKGTSGNTHGYAVQQFAGSLPIDSETLPADLEDKFSSAELHLLETKIFQPARQAAQEKARAAEHLESDPLWRLDEATRLTLEAAERSERGYVPSSRVAAVQAALSRVKTITPVPTHAPSQTVAHTGAQLPASGQSKGEPLTDALNAIKAARDAVLAGHYGTAQTDKARASPAYRLWAEILEVVEGKKKGTSLLVALQDRKYVKTNKVTARC